MKEKHIFAGNNTSEGFYSYFDYLLKPEDLDHVYILKGGPGVGKSSFMKKYAKKMIEKGYSADFIHCSADNSSLDGILIPELRVLFVDGTAPHVIDPIFPGAFDEIINLAAFLDNEKLKKHKNVIIETNKAKSNIYKSAYKYLKAASIIDDEICTIHDSFVNLSKFNDMCEEAISKLFDNSYIKKTSSVKKFFTESFTAKGYISYTELFFEDNEVWALIGKDTNYSSRFLDRILYEASKRGFDTEIYYNPLKPKQVQHIYLPEKKLILITADQPMNTNYNEIFDIHSIMDSEGIKSKISEIEKNLYLYDLLIKNALDKLSEAKKMHDLLEAFYLNSMDFDQVNDYFEKILTST